MGAQPRAVCAQEAANSPQAMPQEQKPESPTAPTGTPACAATGITKQECNGQGCKRANRPADEHRFWDKTNDWLFAGVGASRTLDYFSTLNMRRRGRQEILLNDDVVDNHAAFAAIEAAGTGVSIGTSYFFHRWGHHKLERWVSIVHIGLATAGSARNYSLKTFHFTNAPPS